MSRPSDYLLALGWRPSPTTFAADGVCHGAWEHDALSILPLRYSVVAQDLYDPRLCRFPTREALAVTSLSLALNEACILIPRSASVSEQLRCLAVDLEDL